MQVARFGSAAALTMLLAACNAVPRDPEHTLNHVEHGVLHVGVAENPPYTAALHSGSDAPVRGVEVDLVNELAQELGARVEWTVGDPDTLLRSLERFEIDLVVGGLTDDSPWKKRVAFTAPYASHRVCFGVAPGVPLGELRGRTVAIEREAPFAHALAKKDAVAFRVDDLSRVPPPVLAPDWKLDALGLQRTDECVENEKHVMAVPPGENRFAMRVERFLVGKSSSVSDRLRRSTHDATTARNP